MITKTPMAILAASLAATLAIPVTAMAEGECQQDRQKFCKNETRANVGACLDQHTDELSEACKAMQEARALASPASAETSPKPPNAQTEGNLPAESKPGEVAEQPESTEVAKQPNPSEAASQLDGPAAQTGSTPEAAKSAASPEPAQSGSQILINVDKSRQQMTVLVDGIEKYSWPVSTGKYGYSTPSGTFTPTSMNEVWYSKQWDNAPMPHSIFFLKDGHAIHGSHEVKSLGKPVSHGCVRISSDNAAILYDLVKTNGMTNTKVVLAGITPGDESNEPDEPAYSYGVAPWRPGPGYFPPPPPRRGLFGGWFRGPYGGPQGYYRPPRGYYRGY